jgi:hypothetical protein
MYDENGKQEKTGAHAITITGIAENGDLIVSSWGKKYTVKRNDYSTIDRIIYWFQGGEYVVYDHTKMETE